MIIIWKQINHPGLHQDLQGPIRKGKDEFIQWQVFILPASLYLREWSGWRDNEKIWDGFVYLTALCSLFCTFSTPAPPVFMPSFLLLDGNEMRDPLWSHLILQTQARSYRERNNLCHWYSNHTPPKLQMFLFLMCYSGSEYSDVAWCDINHYLLACKVIKPRIQ